MGGHSQPKTGRKHRERRIREKARKGEERRPFPVPSSLLLASPFESKPRGTGPRPEPWADHSESGNAGGSPIPRGRNHPQSQPGVPSPCRSSSPPLTSLRQLLRAAQSSWSLMIHYLYPSLSLLSQLSQCRSLSVYCGLLANNTL